MIVAVYSEKISQIPEEAHTWYNMIFELRNGSNDTVATKNIGDVYPNALSVRKCQRLLFKFKSDNFDLSGLYRSMAYHGWK